MKLVTLASGIAKNQTTDAVDCTGWMPMYLQAWNTGAALTAGTFDLETSLDGTHFDQATKPISLAYTDVTNSIIKSFTNGFPFVRVKVASLAFTYGKAQTGTGLSDLTVAGTYTPLVNHTYIVKVSTAAGTDKFVWNKDGGAWSAEVSMTGSAQALVDGVTVQFAATTGHSKDDYWTITTPNITIQAGL